MQLALTASVLVPLGVGLAAVLVVLAVVLMIGGRKRDAGEPEPPAPEQQEETAASEPAAPAEQANASRVTVAEALAVRDADTAPLPVQSEAYLPSVPEPRAPAVVMAASGAASNGGAPRPAVAASTSPAEEPDVTSAESDPSPESNEKLETAPEDESDTPSGGDTHSGDADVEQPADPTLTGAIPISRPAVSTAGSSRTVAAAVAQALAVRAAVDRPTGGPAPEAAPAPDPVTAGSRGDVRDRLLAVLLADPARAVGAAVELETCRGQLERLSEAVQHERKSLGDALSRLAGAGLRPEQLAKLASLPVADVQEMLGGREPAQGQG